MPTVTANEPIDQVLSQFDTDFAAPVEPTKTKSASKPASAEQKYRREIDLGDGSGKQVFEAESWEELADELAKAQTNATKKIREQNKALKEARRQAPVTPKPVEEVKPLSADEEFLLGQQLGQKPSEAFKRLFEVNVGMSLETFKSRFGANGAVEALVQAQTVNQAAQEFLTDHADDYLPTPGNYRKLQNYLDENNLPLTRENLEEAFEELSSDGKLKPVETKEKTEEETPRIEESKPKHTSSGLSSRSSRREPAQNPSQPAVSDEEIMSLPLDQARDRIVRALHSQRGQ